MKIYIIRHADPDYSIDSLTPKGWREAELLSDRVVRLSIDDFYCSPFGRAKDTAKATLEKLRKEAEILDFLQEFEGRLVSPYTGNTRVSWDIPPFEWCNQMQYYTLNEWDKPDWIAGSTASNSYLNVTNGIDQLLLRYGWKRDGMVYYGGEDKTIALFCHFALGITVLSYLLGISPVVAQNNFFLPPTSVSTLVTETDAKGCSHFRATAVGDTSHLYVANEPVSESGLYPNFMK